MDDRIWAKQVAESPGMVILHENLTPERYEVLRSEWQEMIAGGHNFQTGDIITWPDGTTGTYWRFEERTSDD